MSVRQWQRITIKQINVANSSSHPVNKRFDAIANKLQFPELNQFSVINDSFFYCKVVVSFLFYLCSALNRSVVKS